MLHSRVRRCNKSVPYVSPVTEHHLYIIATVKGHVSTYRIVGFICEVQFLQIVDFIV